MFLATLVFFSPGLAPSADDFSTQGRKLATLVRQEFFDAKRAEAWWEKHQQLGQGQGGATAFTAAARAALAELQTSHTGYYTRGDIEFHALRSIFQAPLNIPEAEVLVPSIGVDLTPAGFVRTVFAGSPADKHGLRRGDRLLDQSGNPFQVYRSIPASVAVVTLQVQRRPDVPPLVRQIEVRRLDPKKEWQQHQREGSRLLPGAGAVAYVPLFSGAGVDYEEELQQALQGRLRQAQALILDLRGGWGGCNPWFVHRFETRPPILVSIDRRGNHRFFSDAIQLPLVLLINGGTRSGKEVVAHGLEQTGRAKLVGTRTAGAVVAGRCFPLTNDALLFLAVYDSTVDGIRLEGVGVAPDILVEDQLPFAHGKDPQLEAALKLAREMIPNRQSK